MNPKILERLKNSVQPKTFYEDLAEYGYLKEYLDTFLVEEFASNKEFREEMLYLLYKYSQEPVLELDLHYLQHLSQSLDFFMESNRQWLIQRQ